MGCDMFSVGEDDALEREWERLGNAADSSSNNLQQERRNTMLTSESNFTPEDMSRKNSTYAHLQHLEQH